jgi:glycine/D-amino acid oxidase-like deaminating enzyme
MLPQSEFVIVGQGLAGTALAWALLRRGRNVLVVDRERGESASRIAAGLITPVTGKRLAKSWRWDELYPAAVEFYRSIEAETGASFFSQQPSLRLFADEAERDEFHRREANILRGLVRPVSHINNEWFDAPFGGFEMPSAARLDVSRYLDTSRDYFRARGFFTSPLEGEVGEALRAGWGVSSKAQSETSHPTRTPSVCDLPLKGGGEILVLCRGFTSDSDPYFGGIKFNAAKGEILMVRVPGLAEQRVVHRGIWLVPLGGDYFRVGATHTWEPLDAIPTAEGRAELESKLRAFLKLPYEVIDHRAAVRPVIDAGFPVLGRHPAHPRLAYFNGLGAKGSLLSPFFANQLAAHLCGEGEIEDAVNVRKYLCRD